MGTPTQNGERGNRTGRLLTAICGLAGVALCAFALWPGTAAPRVILTGMWLQLLGVATVAIGIMESRKRLKKPRLRRIALDRLAAAFRTARDRLQPLWAWIRASWAHVRDLWRRLIARFGKQGSAAITPPSATVQLSGIAASSSTARATPLTMEALHAQLTAQSRRIDELHEQLRTETDARRRRDEDLHQLVDDLQTGGVVLSLTGLVCLAAGIVMTSIPDWIVGHVASLFASSSVPRHAGQSIASTIDVWIVAGIVLVLLGMLAISYWGSSIRSMLSEFQVLIAGFLAVAAAFVALAGVRYQIRAQTEQFQADIHNRRRSELRAEARQRQQSASAFVGEISAILESFRDPSWLDRPRDTITQIEHARLAGAKSLTVSMSDPITDLAPYFHANPAAVGEFPTPIPQQLLVFYGLYAQLQDNVRAMSTAYVQRRTPAEVETELKAQIDELRTLKTAANVLIPQLQKIAGSARDPSALTLPRD